MGVSHIHSHATISNLDKWVEVSMSNPETLSPCKFTTLLHKYMDLRTPEGLEVYRAVISRIETATCGSSVDCLYLAGNMLAKDLSSKIAVCPSAWWWHLFKLRGYNERNAHSLMDSFKYEASQLANLSTFDERTWIVTTQFANADDFLNRVEAELGFDGDDDQSLDRSVDGTTNPKTSFKISADARAALASSLDDPNMDLTANSHASAKSHCTIFSSATGNSTNRSVNTKQFAIAHKSCTLKLAMEKNRAAQLEFENRDMTRRLQELEAMLARGLTTTIPPTTTPAPPARWSIRIAGAESANTAGEGLGSGNTSPNVTNKSMVDNDLPIPICGGGGTTQYQPSTDDDDAGSDLPLFHQGGGFTSHYYSPQRTANELPSVEDTLVSGR
jgi:hypothetical protein